MLRQRRMGGNGRRRGTRGLRRRLHAEEGRDLLRVGTARHLLRLLVAVPRQQRLAVFVFFGQEQVVGGFERSDVAFPGRVEIHHVGHQGCRALELAREFSTLHLFHQLSLVHVGLEKTGIRIALHET